MEQKIIVCDTEKCTGCRICEYICAAVNEGKINPRLSRIRTIRIDPIFNLSMSCRKCDNPKCLDACARNAIKQDEKTKLITVDKDKCDGCGYCIEQCQFGVLSMGIDKKVALVCDTCKENNDGKPACVDYCPVEALSFVPISKIEDKKAKKFHKTLQEGIDKKE
ncbi:4Fe-4S dicluster domain-containing protein [Candidatus Woesearchaeota archaeon]|nr:4Fe-4S dicluster domain-containing protein [Candidatus Woesearchaeota archaeon]